MAPQASIKRQLNSQLQVDFIPTYKLAPLFPEISSHIQIFIRKLEFNCVANKVDLAPRRADLDLTACISLLRRRTKVFNYWRQ